MGISLRTKLSKFVIMIAKPSDFRPAVVPAFCFLLGMHLWKPSLPHRTLLAVPDEQVSVKIKAPPSDLHDKASAELLH